MISPSLSFADGRTDANQNNRDSQQRKQHTFRQVGVVEQADKGGQRNPSPSQVSHCDSFLVRTRNSFCNCNNFW